MDPKRVLRLRVSLALEVAGVTIPELAKRYKTAASYLRRVFGEPTWQPAMWEKLAKDLGYDPRTEIGPGLKDLLNKLAKP